MLSEGIDLVVERLDPLMQIVRSGQYRAVFWGQLGGHLRSDLDGVVSIIRRLLDNGTGAFQRAQDGLDRGSGI